MSRRIPEFVNPVAGRFIAAYGEECYRRDYNRGWSATCNLDRADDNGWTDSDAWLDGFLDQAAGRDKWHLPACGKHDNSDSGCGVA